MTARTIFGIVVLLLGACGSSDRNISVEGDYKFIFKMNAGAFELAILHYLITPDKAYYLWFRDDVVVAVPDGIEPGANSYALEPGGRFAGVVYPGKRYQAVGRLHPRGQGAPRLETEEDEADQFTLALDFREAMRDQRMSQIPETYDDKPVDVLFVASFGPTGVELEMPPNP